MPDLTQSIGEDAEFERFYRAVRSRDGRFDGQFFTAVATTGIYCRPSCPAQTPRPQNVRFFRHAAAAVAAGFRACRRCRPDTAPGSRDWDARADLAARALRLIADGAADAEGVSGLARRLAVSERHLHRTLVAEVGAGPLALARTRRAQTARLLVDNTELPLGDICFAAGFGSIRQFNDTMRAEFGRPPSDLRRPTSREARVDGTGGLTLRLAYRPPLHWPSLRDWFAARAVPGVEEVTDRTYRRAVPHGDAAVVVTLEPARDAAYVLLRCRLDDLRALAGLVARCRRLLDLDADPHAVADALGADPLLAPLVAARPGLRVPGAVDGFELAARAVLGQQVTVAAARTFAGRLVALAGPKLSTVDGTVARGFPAAAALADADLAGIGLTAARAGALRALARTVADGELDLSPGADRAAARRKLQAIRGVGRWTAEYVAMRALADPDAFPADDRELRRAGATLADAERWRPWRAYAAMHLWSRKELTA